MGVWFAHLVCTVIADGYACREQMEQSTGPSTLHLAEVLHMARREAG